MAKKPADISASTCFRVAPVPDFGLEEDVSFPLRVYVLKCQNGAWYTGITPKAKVQERIREQFLHSQALGSSHFCEANPPVSVVCVWPAKNRCVEAAVFFAMMEALGTTDFKKLGGWVFTSSKPSPLAFCIRMSRPTTNVGWQTLSRANCRMCWSHCRARFHPKSENMSAGRPLQPMPMYSH